MGNLKPIEPLEPKDLSNIFRPTRAPISKIQKREKSSSKILKNVLDTLDESVKDLDKTSGPAPDERFAIYTQELQIKNIYDNVEYLNNKLKDNNLALAKYKKIN